MQKSTANATKWFRRGKSLELSGHRAAANRCYLRCANWWNRAIANSMKTKLTIGLGLLLAAILKTHASEIIVTAPLPELAQTATVAPLTTPAPAPKALTTDGTGTNIIAALPSGGTLSQIWSFVSASQILQSSNWLVAPYGTYAPKAPTKYGGGLFLAYNLNNYAAAGIGFDYLGNFSLVSANLSLKADTHPLRGLFGNTATNGFFYDFTLTPFALGGAGVDVGGTGSHIVWDVGVHTKFGHLLGGKFGVGVAYGGWVGDSPYDVNRYHLFLDWSKHF